MRHCEGEATMAWHLVRLLIVGGEDFILRGRLRRENHEKTLHLWSRCVRSIVEVRYVPIVPRITVPSIIYTSYWLIINHASLSDNALLNNNCCLTMEQEYRSIHLHHSHGHNWKIANLNQTPFFFVRFGFPPKGAGTKVWLYSLICGMYLRDTKIW